MTTCAHPEFEASVIVNRIEDIGKFVADVEVRCAKCGTRFAFVGVRSGLSYGKPMVSPDRLQLRVPIEPDAHATSLMAGDEQLRFPRTPGSYPTVEP